MIMQAEWISFLLEAGAQLDGAGIPDFLPEDGKDEAGSPGYSFMTALSGYSILKISGNDAGAFLHAQLSNDVRRLEPGSIGMGSWCNTQGRMLMNFYLIRNEDHFFLILRSGLKDKVIKRLTKYILRSSVSIEDMDHELALAGISCSTGEERVEPILGSPAPAMHTSILHQGLRVSRVGDAGSHRYLILGTIREMKSFWGRAAGKLRPEPRESWKLQDILDGLGWVDENNTEQFLPVEFNLDYLGGVSYGKGCYPGQEILARIRHRGRVKKRLYLAHLKNGTLPQSGEDLTADGDPHHIGCIIEAASIPGSRYAVLAVVDCELVRNKPVYTVHDRRLLEFIPLPYTRGPDEDSGGKSEASKPWRG